MLILKGPKVTGNKTLCKITMIHGYHPCWETLDNFLDYYTTKISSHGQS